MGIRFLAKDYNNIGNDFSVIVHSDMKVENISFHEPIKSGNLQEIYDNWIWYDFENSIDRGLELIPWEGYGTYENSRKK